jgi:hypothetical protein
MEQIKHAMSLQCLCDDFCHCSAMLENKMDKEFLSRVGYAVLILLAGSSLHKSQPCTMFPNTRIPDILIPHAQPQCELVSIDAYLTALLPSPPTSYYHPHLHALPARNTSLHPAHPRPLFLLLFFPRLHTSKREPSIPPCPKRVSAAPKLDY